MVLPSLAQKGPIIVAKDIIEQLINDCYFEVFYFDDIIELDFPCKVTQIDKYYKIEGFDIIHSHMLRPDIYNSKIKDKVIKITTIHNYMYYDLSDTYGRFIGYIYEKIWCYKLRKFDRIVTLSNNMKNYYMAKIPSDNINVIYNGRPILDVKIDHNELVDNVSKFKDEFILIGVFCLLNYRKGIDRIIKMLSISNRYKLLVVGDGPEKRVLQKMAKKLKVDDRIFWAGFQKNPRQFYQLVDLNIMASRTEGFPLALLEMGMNKIPTACVDMEIFKELYTSDEVVFFESDNEKSMLEACEELILNKDVYSMKFNKKTESQYSVEVMGNSYKKLYKSF